MKCTIERKHAIVTLDTTTGKITGNTYPLKDWLKSYMPEMRWNRDERCWEIDPELMIEYITKYRSPAWAGYFEVTEPDPEEVEAAVAEAVAEEIETAAEEPAEAPAVETETTAERIVAEAAEEVYTDYATTDNTVSRVGDALHTQTVADIRKRIDTTILPAFAAALHGTDPQSITDWQAVILAVNTALATADRRSREVFAKMLQPLQSKLIATGIR